MSDLIDRQALIGVFAGLVPYAIDSPEDDAYARGLDAGYQVLVAAPTVDAVEIPPTGIGDLSDGYHTFNGLYHQRLILFAALVKVYKDKAWKSHRHENGELCFGGGWFIVGIDTPEGSYTYHYEDKYYDLFDCVELPVGKHWDGHTEKDVTRLMSLPVDAEPVRRGRWIDKKVVDDIKLQQMQEAKCSVCGRYLSTPYVYYWTTYNYCPHCGAKNVEVEDNGSIRE